MIRHPVRRLGERCLASVTRACAIPSVVAFVNTGAVVIHGKYRSSEVNKTIVISIIDRNVYRWVTAKRWFSQLDWFPFPAALLAARAVAVVPVHQSTWSNKQRFLTPGHQGWNDLHSLCRIGMEYYLLNNDDNNIIYWIMMIIMIMMMIIIMIIMMTMMIIGTATIMIMIIIITTTLTMTIMKMIMIKTAQTPCQSLYKERRI